MESYNNTTNYRNLTHPPSPAWAPLTSAQVSISCLSVLLNAIVLIVQFLPQTHVTSFTIYLIFISVSSVLWLIATRPIQILYAFTGSWPGGDPGCVVFMYFQFVVSQIPVLIHILISVNRLWAVKYPVSYRERHNKKLAILLCLAVVAYVHLVHFSIYLLEFFYYNPPGKTGGCQPSGGSLNWRRVDIVLHRIIPLFTVITMYVYIMVHRWRKKGQVQNQENKASGQTSKGQTSHDTVKPERGGAAGNPGQSVYQRKRQQVKPFVVLTATSIVVFVCWVPPIVYWSMVYMNIPVANWAINATSMFYSCQMIFDPLVWLFSLR
ncbi:probable G-protein coupled receptor 19 [Paramacrobiotus metropolitanus]|uniref:probable G-protein coupled receptor 19 n=1 Tax=Paramacrobiotus metropolitanus TaxID=2943436 RepID=UPI0024456249|nr:probable G-protein coupled receptor 19 [Paramacrobiotus metropolitanus]